MEKLNVIFVKATQDDNKSNSEIETKGCNFLKTKQK